MSYLYHNSTIHRVPVGHAGKAGGFFRFAGQGNKVFAISNNHVIANLNNCAVGDPIAAGNQVVGNLYGWVNLNLAGVNTLDLAFFELSSGVTPVWNMPGNLTRPVDFIGAVINGHVYISKPNEEFRYGYIKNFVPEPLSFNAGGQSLTFTGLYAVQSIDGRPLTVPGDSGSLVFSSNHMIVGLIVGGEDYAPVSYFIPFSTILKKYKLDIY